MIASKKRDEYTGRKTPYNGALVSCVESYARQPKSV